jgi:hypothetical protein
MTQIESPAIDPSRRPEAMRQPVGHTQDQTAGDRAT